MTGPSRQNPSSTSKDKSSLTKALLSRSHDETAVTRLFTEKIQHRPFLLRPSSPPPGANARAQRRHERRKKLQDRKRTKPKPLSARQRRGMGLYDVPPESRRYELFEPLHGLWLGYIHEILGKEVSIGGPGVAARLACADFHGAEVEVSRSGCPSRVGLKGIVIKDSKHIFEIITRRNKVKIVPKESTVFRVEIPSPECAGANQETRKKAVDEKVVSSTSEDSTRDAPGHGGRAGENRDDQGQPQTAGKDKPRQLVVEVYGEQFRIRSSERANKKYKTHFLKDI